MRRIVALHAQLRKNTLIPIACCRTCLNDWAEFMNDDERQAWCPDTGELQRTLEDLIFKSTGGAKKISGLQRKSFTYSTSFPLELLTLQFTNGAQLELLFKNLSPGALHSTAQRVRPAFLSNPCREIEVYRSILPMAPQGVRPRTSLVTSVKVPLPLFRYS